MKIKIRKGTCGVEVVNADSNELIEGITSLTLRAEPFHTEIVLTFDSTDVMLEELNLDLDIIGVDVENSIVTASKNQEPVAELVKL